MGSETTRADWELSYYASNPAAPPHYVRGGRVFAAACGQLDVGLGERLVGTFQNPVDSGRKAFIHQLVIYSDGNIGAFANLMINPTGGLPVTVRPNENQYIGHGRTSPMVVKIDDQTTALTGGQPSNQAFRLSQGRTEINLSPLIIPPGITLGIHSGQAATSVNVNAIIYWYEEAI